MFLYIFDVCHTPCTFTDFYNKFNPCSYCRSFFHISLLLFIQRLALTSYFWLIAIPLYMQFIWISIISIVYFNCRWLLKGIRFSPVLLLFSLIWSVFLVPGRIINMYRIINVWMQERWEKATTTSGSIKKIAVKHIETGKYFAISQITLHRRKKPWEKNPILLMWS